MDSPVTFYHVYKTLCKHFKIYSIKVPKLQNIAYIRWFGKSRILNIFQSKTNLRFHPKNLYLIYSSDETPLWIIFTQFWGGSAGGICRNCMELPFHEYYLSLLIVSVVYPYPFCPVSKLSKLLKVISWYLHLECVLLFSCHIFFKPDINNHDMQHACCLNLECDDASKQRHKII